VQGRPYTTAGPKGPALHTACTPRVHATVVDA
jgi:hypothetical protein